MYDGQTMPFDEHTRVVTTAELVELNRMATEFRATRVFDPYELLNLDQTGLHFLTHCPLFWHPFRRCEVAIKVQGKSEPVFAWLDLQDEWYDPLTTLGDYVKALKYYETHPRRAHG